MNRNASSDDIYLLRLEDIRIKGVVVETGIGVVIPGAEININNCATNKDLPKLSSNSEGGFEFKVRDHSCLNLEVSKEGYYIVKKKVFNSTDIRIEMQPKRYELTVMDVSSKEVIGMSKVSCNDNLLWRTNSMGLISIKYGEEISCDLQISADGYLSQRYSCELHCKKRLFRRVG